jgi:isocitrate/isopropylmalate dehydrogenase
VKAAGAIGDAVDRLLASPQTRTRDLGGALGTAAFSEAVAERLA